MLTHTLAFSASQFVRKKSPRIYTSTRMHSGESELTKLTYTRLEDNLIRHRGDRPYTWYQVPCIHMMRETKLNRAAKLNIRTITIFRNSLVIFLEMLNV